MRSIVNLSPIFSLHIFLRYYFIKVGIFLSIQMFFNPFIVFLLLLDYNIKQRVVHFAFAL